jgi:hypothetical protein
MKPRIMVYIPLNPTHPRIEARTLQSVMAIDWDTPFEVVLGREDRAEIPDTPGKYASLTAKYNQAATLALSGGYDSLLTIEADMVIPAMALRRMTLVNADVVYGLYCSRRPGRRQGSDRWLIFSDVNINPFTVKKLAADAGMRKQIWGEVVESQGIGLGCTLINRQVLEQIPFRCPDPEVSCDWYFAYDCQRTGFTQAHDCGVVCGHIDGDATYWPDPERGFWVEG